MACSFHLVIPDGSGSVLLVEDGSGWALPRSSSDEPEIVVDVAPALRELVADDLFVLRDVRFGPMPPPENRIAYLTEPVRDPRAARGWWCTQGELARADLTEPRDRAALEAWFRGDEPSSLQPWQRDGWFAAARTWIEEVLPDVSEVRQFATWCNSCILRVTSARGRAWFKSVPAAWASEPIVTSMLAELFPARTPQVLALEKERGWMMLEDIDGTPMDGVPAHERPEALEAVGELHRASAPLVDALLAGGCVDRRPAVLSGQIAALAVDPTVPLPGDLDLRLRAAVPRLQEICAELAAATLPPTLVHGDLHAGNLMRVDDGYVAFDWSDACVADPYVDVLMFLSRMPDEPALRQEARERYLGAWPGLTGMEAAAYIELAEPLAAMHHAVTYRGIYDAFGPYEWWLFEGALPRWIEHALACPIVGG